MNTTRRRIRHVARRALARRRGSVLVVVLALLSALMLLGFLFYTTASQERANARSFAASEKFYSSTEQPGICDFALEQIILGAPDNLPNSALWGGRWSLLASMVGTDVIPYNGTGVNVVDQGVFGGGAATGVPGVDQDYDAALDGNLLLKMHMADWAAADPANTVLPIFDVSGGGVFPEPDVGYTYPDLNSLYLSYIGTEPMFGKQVVIPSFHRPQYLRASYTDGTWYTDAASQPFVLRPHDKRKVRYFDEASGSIVDTTLPRFLPEFWGDPNVDPLKVAQNPKEGYWDQSFDTSTTPPTPIYEYDVDTNLDGVKESVLLDLDYPVEQSADGSYFYIPLVAVMIRDLDSLLNVNAHGNLYNIPDTLTSVLPNPNTPFLSASNEGRHPHEINPIYAFTAPGSDYAAHISVPPPTKSEATGDEPGFFGATAGTPTTIQLANIEFWFTLVGRATAVAGTPPTISESTVGRWGEETLLKNAVRAGGGTTYGSPMASVYPRPGRTGHDDKRMTSSDQNRGLIYQDVTGYIFPKTLRFLAPGHPEDHQGQGTFAAGAFGRAMQLVPLVTGVERVRVPGYANYWLPHSINSATPTQQDWAPRWLVEQVTNAITPQIVSIAGFGLRGLHGLYIDDPGETILDPTQSDPFDNIFGPGETAALHMSDEAFNNANMTSRLLELVPANFAGTNAIERRERVTTYSRDLKSYAYTRDPYSGRQWEMRGTGLAPATTNDQNVFPPLFGPAGGTFDVFRREARSILQQSQNVLRAGAPNSNQVKGLVRKLSMNQIAALAKPSGDGNARYMLRPLTPHPQPKTTQAGMKLSAMPIPIPAYADGDGDGNRDSGSRVFGVPDQVLVDNVMATWNMSTPAAPFTTAEQLQEWHARRDRQNMARDIFTLLYLTSHVDPAFRPTTMSPTAATPRYYTNAQLREMAQFAVNVVDAMDPDDTITLFVYDKDFIAADAAGHVGYTYRDDGYSDPPPYVTTASGTVATGDYIPAGAYEDADRGMVFGVEAQQLAFNEALAVLAKDYDDDSDDTTPAQDHEATLWNDTAHRDFMFLELQNMTPYEVTLDGGWSIVCQPTDTSGGTTFPGRSLTILNASGQDPDGNPYTNVAAPGATFTIGAAGDDHLNDNPPTYTPPQGTTYGSALRVDQDGSASAPPADFAGFDKIAPAVTTNPDGPLQFDTIDAAAGEVNVNNYDPDRPWDDGDVIDETNLIAEAGMVAPHPVGSAWLNLGAQNINDTDTRDGINVGDVTIDFILRRRANLHRDFPSQDNTTADDEQQKDNPWIVVDRWENVPLRVFDPSDTGIPLADKLHDLVSSKRYEPLDRDRFLADDERNISTYQRNNLGGYHPDDTATPTRIWQRHYDRSFASLADLLQVPLYGPGDLTDTVNTVARDDAGLLSLAAVNDPTSHALARFLFPDGEPRGVDIDDDGTSQKVRPDGNLWYRLFGFVEVPSKYGQPDQMPWFVDLAGLAKWKPDMNNLPDLRRFGQINLNTLRHPHVLAGLLDDPRAIEYAPLMAGGRTLLSKDTSVTMFSGASRRDWWKGLLHSRDGGFDPLTGGSLILPGLPMAEPFRAFSVAPTTATLPSSGQIYESFSQTLLRTLPGDDGTPAFTPGTDEFRRSLFELGKVGTAASILGSSDADIATRYRLLGKALKFGTTRSNTYVIFMTVDYYTATPQPTPGGTVYQIGEKIPADPLNPDEPRVRSVFVVDRTIALRMLEQKDLPPTSAPEDTPRVYPSGSKYRTFSFARDATGGDAKPAFDWRELIVYEKILKQ